MTHLLQLPRRWVSSTCLQKNLANVAHVLHSGVKLVEFQQRQVGLLVVTDLLDLAIYVSVKRKINKSTIRKDCFQVKSKFITDV